LFCHNKILIIKNIAGNQIALGETYAFNRTKRNRKKINHLSHQEQLWLIEKLARRLREDASNSVAIAPSGLAAQLVTMASDPEMRAELQKIEQEFAL